MSTRRVTDFLSKEELRELTRASDLRGARSVLITWGMIAGAFTLAAWSPGVWTALIAVLLLGGRQLALAVLMHECSHRALFASRRANDLVGHWLCGAPVWTDLVRYRRHHLAHHNHTGTARDTDIGLVEPFPVTRRGLTRKLLRDLSGLTGLRRVVGLLLMDLGLITYTASTGARRVDQRARSLPDILRTSAHNLAPVILTNATLAAVLIAVGEGWLYGLWIAAYMTVFSVLVRLRSIAEHACTERSADVFENTRTTHAGWLARLTLAPHDVNYHLEHHLLMTVPHYKLARLHRLLRARGALDGSPLADGYVEILRQVTTPTS